ncbi:hypothetical protein RCG19_02640 [Neobacillus sp. OS1-2]|uniref:hypothetical protein n=1 Tax=Neobacillus sp. OS1-2 TaxID=3070680 RepID=UPI0027E1A61A|nr:hypothetical protein [Neobacillus sp. OS1-2]WML40604.1 hypothetical protein RCG19_02640 [Neobacillus sp. OS1-2]
METILFFIIVGIISTIFGKTKRTQGQSPRKPFKVSGMEDVRTLVKELTNEVSHQAAPVKSAQKVEVLQENNRKLEQEYDQVRKESESSRRALATARLQREKMKEQTVAATMDEDEPNISTEPNAQSLVNGVIWAEILGEPRSKKPYFPKRG